ncbi:MAG: alpha/beta hydrolase [Pirellulales bacterium]
MLRPVALQSRVLNDGFHVVNTASGMATRCIVRGRHLGLRAAIFASLCLAMGCVSNDYLEVRRAPRNPLADTLQLFSWSGPQPSSRTEQVLRQYDLTEEREKDAPIALASLEKRIEEQPAPETIYSYAELAYIDGQRADARGDDQQALDYYGAALGHAYWYLFDSRLDWSRNPYDPQFRQACDLYNGALESVLRILQARGQLKVGTVQPIRTAQKNVELSIESCGPWSAEEIERVEFCSDFEVSGLTNQYRTYGLGVPLAAVRRNRPPNAQAAEEFYPNNLCFPATAFLRVHRPAADVRQTVGEPAAPRFVLELHDPLAAQQIRVGERLVPLETDLSTPLAYFLDNMKVAPEALATWGLIKPAAAETASRIYMLEPYSPQKIPVILVHGLWSSPMTWMEMFNDLRGLSEVRDHYQFWFYLYPTGQPFWESAADFREDLKEVQDRLDPQRNTPALQNMVVVGHSMGGLVSTLQTIDIGDRIWRSVANKPFDELNADTDTRAELARVAFFEPNRSIRRVVTIGTPHRGSKFANDYTRWLGQKLISMPRKLTVSFQKLSRDNPGYFRNVEPLTIKTSIDSLDPSCPLFSVLANAPRAPWVKYDNIAGVISRDDVLAKFTETGDGIVSFKSAHLTEANSELVVPATHTAVHRHPRSILAVRGILLEHLAEMRLESMTVESLVPPDAAFPGADGAPPSSTP